MAVKEEQTAVPEETGVVGGWEEAGREARGRAGRQGAVG